MITVQSAAHKMNCRASTVLFLIYKGNIVLQLHGPQGTGRSYRYNRSGGRGGLFFFQGFMIPSVLDYSLNGLTSENKNICAFILSRNNICKVRVETKLSSQERVLLL